MSLADEIAVLKRILTDATDGYIVNARDLDKDEISALRSIKERLEGMAAPGDTTERAMAEAERLGCRSFPGIGTDLTIKVGRLRTIIDAAIIAAEDGARRAALIEGFEKARGMIAHIVDGYGAPELAGTIRILSSDRALATEATPGEGGTTDG
jgi:hypothetical protein